MSGTLKAKAPAAGRKKKTTVATAPVVAEQLKAVEAPKVVEQPKVPELAKPAEPAVTEATPKKVNTGIRAARVRRDIDSNLLNKQLLEHLTEPRKIVEKRKMLQNCLATGKITVDKVERDITSDERAKFTAELASGVEVWQRALQEIEMYKSHRTRFSAATSAALTALANHVLRTLLCFGSKRLSDKENTLYLRHIAHQSAKQLDIYAILRNLPVFMAEVEAQHVKEMNEARALETKRIQKEAVREFKRLYQVVISRTNKPVLPATEPVAPAAPVAAAPSEKKPTHPFKVYVTQTWKAHPANTRANKVKLSTDVKDFLANLVAQLIEVVSKIAEHQMASKNTKTINCGAIIDAVTTFYIAYGAERTEVFTQKEGDVIPPAVLAAEKEKKRVDPNYVIEKDKLPKVKGTVVERSVNYTSKGLDDIKASIDAAVAQINNKPQSVESN